MGFYIQGGIMGNRIALAFLFGVLFCVLNGSIVIAGEQHLLKIIVEPENNKIINLVLTTTDADAHLDSLNFFTENKTENKRFLIEDVVSGEVLVFQRDGRDIFFLSCPKCTIDQGGKVKTRYLNNGIWGTYKTTEMYLEKQKGEWKLFNTPPSSTPRKQIYTATLKSNYSFGTVVGIKEILFNQGRSFFQFIQRFFFLG